MNTKFFCKISKLVKDLEEKKIFWTSKNLQICFLFLFNLFGLSLLEKRIIKDQSIILI